MYHFVDNVLATDIKLKKLPIPKTEKGVLHATMIKVILSRGSVT